MSIQELRVNSLAELISAVTPTAPDPESGRLRSYAVYRGVDNVDFSLLSSLDRLGTPEELPHTKGLDLEEHILRNFIRYSRPYLPSPQPNDWELLVIAQHHGLATRLLDSTYSPLVAAHFAVLTSAPNDRVIRRLDYRRMHERFSLPPLALTVAELDQALRSRGINSIWDFFHAQNLQGGDFACLLEPASLNPRLVAQSATFTISSDKTRPLNQVLESAGLDGALTRYTIPLAAVPRVRDQLDLCGISERRLFPDLEGVAEEMRRYYAASAERATRLD